MALRGSGWVCAEMGFGGQHGGSLILLLCCLPSQNDLYAAQASADAAQQQAADADVRAAAAAAQAAAAAATAAAPAAAQAPASPAANTPAAAGTAAGTPGSSAAAVSAAVAAALASGGDGGGSAALDNLLSPGGTTLRFTGPTLGYAEAAAASPPAGAAPGGRGASMSPPSGFAAAGGRVQQQQQQRLPHSRSESISSEIEPAEEVALPQQLSPSEAGAARRPPLGAASPQSQLAQQLGALRARMAALEAELADSERTHTLRDKATAVLKEEIAELRWGWLAGWLAGWLVWGWDAWLQERWLVEARQRSILLRAWLIKPCHEKSVCGCLPIPACRRKQKRGGVDVTYIKNVLLRAFESGGWVGGCRAACWIARPPRGCAGVGLCCYAQALLSCCASFFSHLCPPSHPPD
jgi:hypothetical protein